VDEILTGFSIALGLPNVPERQDKICHQCCLMG